MIIKFIRKWYPMDITFGSISTIIHANNRSLRHILKTLDGGKTSAITYTFRPFSAIRDDPAVINVPNPSSRNKDNPSTDCASIGGPIEPSEQVFNCLTEDNQRKLQTLVVECEEFRQNKQPIPHKMTDDQWLDILVTPTRSQRRNLYRFLRNKEVLAHLRKIKKGEAKQERERKLLEAELRVHDNADEMKYGLGGNSIYLKILVTRMKIHFNHWQCHGILFGQNIVLDMDYEKSMTDKESRNCAKQITRMYSANRVNRDPFHFHLCNARPEDAVYKTLLTYLPSLNRPSNFISVHRECYLDVFPKEKLVYLTPHCDETLTHYDHDAVYIIGGIVDKAYPVPLSMEKAQKQGIKMAKLPLDDYLDWKSGRNKLLTLDQMMNIMLDIKNMGDWMKALVHVPRRKLKHEEHPISKKEYLRERRRNFFKLTT